MPQTIVLDTYFHMLELPSDDTAYKDGAHWYVISMVDDLFLLNDVHGILGTLAAPLERYYFDTKAKALEAMLVYYNFHNESFPYVDEYRAAKNMLPRSAIPAGLNRGMLTDAQSQKMEFV